MSIVVFSFACLSVFWMTLGSSPAAMRSEPQCDRGHPRRVRIAE